MKYKPRELEDKLMRMVSGFPVTVLSGARQVGKSTLLAHCLPEWDSVVFDPAIDVGNARQDPELFLQNHVAPLILDEIQYAPEVVGVLKRRVDLDRKNGQYVLTGSQQWSVMKSVSESLAGRAMFLDLEGFCLAELAEEVTEEHWLKRYLEDPLAFVAAKPARLALPQTVFEQLWRGSLPEAQELEAEWVSEFYSAYLRTYVERDIRLLADVSDWQQFGRFVQLLAALTAQEINFSQLSREIGITPQTSQRWLAMLKATFQWYEIPAYDGNTIKRISKKPKGYIADTGLACSLQMLSSPKTLSGHPLTGPLFESAVMAEIRKLSQTLSSPPGLYHWRSHGGAEVDILLERDGRFFPIEVKLASRVSRADTRGIQAFRKTYPTLDVAPGLVICPCEQVQRLNDTDHAIPWDLR